MHTTTLPRVTTHGTRGKNPSARLRRPRHCHISFSIMHPVWALAGGADGKDRLAGEAKKEKNVAAASRAYHQTRWPQMHRSQVADSVQRRVDGKPILSFTLFSTIGMLKMGGQDALAGATMESDGRPRPPPTLSSGWIYSISPLFQIHLNLPHSTRSLVPARCRGRGIFMERHSTPPSPSTNKTSPNYVRDDTAPRSTRHILIATWSRLRHDSGSVEGPPENQSFLVSFLLQCWSLGQGFVLIPMRTRACRTFSSHS